jgi:hydrogenase nickel incorporation protein HypA/HybF
MHELGITRNLVAIVSDAARGRRVTKVWLEIGTLSALMPDAVRFCYDVVAKGTPLEDSVLEIVAVEPGLACADCARVAAGPAGDAASPAAACPHCGGTLRRRSGEELNIKAMELESCA